MQLQPLDKTAYIRQEVLTQPVAGMHHELESGAAQRVEHTVLDTDDVLRVGIVIYQPNEKRAPERQAPRLRIGCVADLLNDGIDLRARGFFYER